MAITAPTRVQYTRDTDTVPHRKTTRPPRSDREALADMRAALDDDDYTAEQSAALLARFRL